MGMSDQWKHMASRVKSFAGRATQSDSRSTATPSATKPTRGEADPAEDADWMSHQSGRVTGVGVTPGEGDSEAGTTSIR